MEELQVLALQFHESLEPLGEWLSTTERRLSSAEPMGTQTAKITQQITKHKVEFRPSVTKVMPKKDSASYMQKIQSLNTVHLSRSQSQLITTRNKNVNTITY